jgi:hypothetical protein
VAAIPYADAQRESGKKPPPQGSPRPSKKPVDNPKIPLDTASYKLYYVNYEMDLD